MIGTRAMHTDAKEHAAELRACRQKAGLTQAGLAQVLGVTRRSVSRWESGRGRLHQIYLQRIRALGQTQAQAKETADALVQVSS